MKISKLFILIPIIGLVSCDDPIKNSISNNGLQSFEVSEFIKNANEYIDMYYDTIDHSRKGAYHLSSPIGWINDPNGFSEFNNQYHLFYQYNPYNAVWGPMHWGHQTTTDFIKWQLEDVALAPDQNYDNIYGCFSGTAFVENDKLYLAYTSVTENQTQSIAYSYDGITFKKCENNPIIDEDEMPDHLSISAFRDPKLFKRNGKYYIICGNEAKDFSSKHLALFESDNIEKGWKYVGNIYSRNDVGGLFECPDLIEFDNTDVLMTSPQSMFNDNKYELQNTDSCIYLVGKLSTNTYKFYNNNLNKEFDEFDKGFSFYAPQTLSTKDGRIILTAWMKSWAESNITEADGWAGSMVLPRELELVNNHIYQKPVREIANYYTNNSNIDSVNITNNSYFIGNDNCYEIDFEIDFTNSQNNTKAGIEVFKGTKYSTKIYYDYDERCVIFDRSNCGSGLDGLRYAKVDSINNKIKFQIFVDKTSVEVFINDGYYTQTGNIFPNINDDGINLFVENGSVIINNINYNHISLE